MQLAALHPGKSQKWRHKIRNGRKQFYRKRGIVHWIRKFERAY